MNNDNPIIRICISLQEHYEAGDYSKPVWVSGQRYWIKNSPIFDAFHDYAVIEAIPADVLDNSYDQQY